MKTDDLIGLLATGAGPAPRAVAARRLAPVMALGWLASALLTIVLVGLVPTELFTAPAWWLKLGYAVAVAGAAGWLASRLGRPAAPTRRAWAGVAAVVLAMAALGVAQLGASDASQRLVLWLGHSWQTCPSSVFGLSLPALALAFWALRGLAPTNPRRAGLAAGLLAGGVGAAGYALSCTEVSMAFVATWYTLGIAATGALGALLGPRLLRW
jgi:hypothetical protein